MIPRVNVTNELQMDLDTRRAQQWQSFCKDVTDRERLALWPDSSTACLVSPVSLRNTGMSTPQLDLNHICLNANSGFFIDKFPGGI